MPDNKIKSIDQIRAEEFEAMERLHYALDFLESKTDMPVNEVICHIKSVMGCVARMQHLINKENDDALV